MLYVALGLSCLETLFVSRVSCVAGATERKDMFLHLQFGQIFFTAAKKKNKKQKQKQKQKLHAQSK